MENLSEIEVSYKPKLSSKISVHNSTEVYKLILENWNENLIEMLEEVKLILLNQASYVLGVYTLSKGGISSSVVDVRVILAIALKSMATGLILVHNHPSGNLNPSEADKKITEKLKEACNLMEIRFLDHLIITKKSYCSFADEGLM